MKTKENSVLSLAFVVVPCILLADINSAEAIVLEYKFNVSATGPLNVEPLSGSFSFNDDNLIVPNNNAGRNGRKTAMLDSFEFQGLALNDVRSKFPVVVFQDNVFQGINFASNQNFIINGDEFQSPQIFNAGFRYEQDGKTYGYKGSSVSYAEVPEPISILGSAVALGFITHLKKKGLSRKK